jgi:hypothetical protein
MLYDDIGKSLLNSMEFAQNVKQWKSVPKTKPSRELRQMIVQMLSYTASPNRACRS